MKLYMDYEFNCGKESTLEDWRDIWENIMSLDDGI